MTPSASSQRLFFCGGLAKSGTTYLAALLNAHPQIACAAEQDLKRLVELLNDATTQYNRRSISLDRRTGGPGRPAFDQNGLTELTRAAALIIVRSRAGGKPIVGMKDNRLFQRIDACGAIFPEARFVNIVRNPVDRAISAWHHNLRLAETEKDPRHSDLVLRHGGLEGWVAHLCRLSRADIATYRAATATRDRRLLLRYEDLVHDPRPHLRRLATFLDADATDATLSLMQRDTTLDAMRGSASDAAFFRAGTIKAGAGELPAAVRLDLARQFEADFALLGYRITADGLELRQMELA